MKKMTYTLIMAGLTMLTAGKSAYAQIPEAKNVPPDTVMYQTTYEMRQTIPSQYDKSKGFSEGKAAVKRNGRWGVLSFRIVKIVVK